MLYHIISYYIILYYINLPHRRRRVPCGGGLPRRSPAPSFSEHGRSGRDTWSVALGVARPPKRSWTYADRAEVYLDALACARRLTFTSCSQFHAPTDIYTLSNARMHCNTHTFTRKPCWAQTSKHIKHTITHRHITTTYKQ